MRTSVIVASLLQTPGAKHARLPETLLMKNLSSFYDIGKSCMGLAWWLGAESVRVLIQM